LCAGTAAANIGCALETAASRADRFGETADEGKRMSRWRNWFGVSTGIGVVAIVAATLIGVTSGVGAYTFVYAKGASYLTDDAAACANCHIMQGQLDGWQLS
jgi:hypothetical protein